MFGIVSRSRYARPAHKTARARRMVFEALETRNLLSATYYVDPNGLGGTPAAATFSTLYGALNLAQPGDTVLLRGGNYSLADVVGPKQECVWSGGLPGAPLTIRAATGEQPVINLAEWYHWQQDPATGYWYVDLPSTSPAINYPDTVGVQVHNGWAASHIPGFSANGVPPAAFTNPSGRYLQGGKLAFDLSWYAAANRRLWLRSNEIQPITNFDAQCGVISAASQFDVHAGWVTLQGLQIQDGYMGIHVCMGDHVVVQDCRVTHCSGQGILIAAPYSEVKNNYVDAIGGALLNDGTLIYRGWQEHCLYLDSAPGSMVHDNFFGRAMNGLSAWIGASNGDVTVFKNNVCYGGSAAGLGFNANVSVTSNVIISPATIWRGGLASDQGARWGIEMLLPQESLTISGNYIEGNNAGVVINYLASVPFGQTLPGWVLTGNTIASTIYNYIIDGLPATLGSNEWAGSPPTFVVPNSSGTHDVLDYAGFLAWEQSHGLGPESGSGTISQIDAAAFNQRLDASPTLEGILAVFRTYATGQVTTLTGNATDPTIAALLGSSTPDLQGMMLLALDDNYGFVPGAVLTIDLAHSVLKNDSDPNGQILAAALASGPVNGQINFSRDGSFVYTPDPGFVGMDSFAYQVNDGKGGTAIATVTLSMHVPAPAPPRASDETYNVQSTLTVDIAHGVLSNDNSPNGQTLFTTLASGPANGQLTFNSDGSFTYTPDSGFTGMDSFTYQVNNGAGGMATATVNLVVSGRSGPRRPPSNPFRPLAID